MRTWMRIPKWLPNLAQFGTGPERWLPFPAFVHLHDTLVPSYPQVLDGRILPVA
jgi:hypothetical protein